MTPLLARLGLCALALAALSAPGQAGDDFILGPRSEVEGHLYRPPAVLPLKPDVYRYHGLEGERLKLGVRRIPYGEFPAAWLIPTALIKPILEVRDADDELIASATGSKRASLVVELPATGEYAIHVLGSLWSYGRYSLTVKSKWPRGAASKAMLPVADGLVFVGRPDVALSAVIKPAPGAGPVLTPRLFGPLGEIDISAFLKTSAKGVKLKKVPLDAFGAYLLSVPSEADGDGGAVQIKARLKSSKPAIVRQHMLEANLPGTWILDGSVPGLSGSWLTLSGDESDGTCAWVIERPQWIMTIPIESWEVDDFASVMLPVGLSLKLDALPSVFEPKVPPDQIDPFSLLLSMWWTFVFTPDQADTLIYEPIDDPLVWRRKPIRPAPAASADVVDTHGHSGLESGLVMLSIEHAPDVIRYEVTRAGDGTGEHTDEPWRSFVPASPDASSVSLVDLEAAPDSGYAYRVRAWTLQGPTAWGPAVSVLD